MAKSQQRTGLEPLVVALIVCDHVHVDPISGRRTILGTFHRMKAAEFPASLSKMAVYVALADGRGRAVIEVRLVDVDEEDEPLWTHSWHVEFNEPGEIQELAMEVADTHFERPGTYRLQLLAGNATIMERSIYLATAPRDSEE